MDDVEAVKAALGGVRVASTPASAQPSPLAPPRPLASSSSSPSLRPALKRSSPSPPKATLDSLFSPGSPRRTPPSVSFDLPSPEPETAGPSRASSAGPKKGPALIPELPLAWDEALASFDSLERCVYERKDLGLSREQDDMMVCDCSYDPGECAVWGKEAAACCAVEEGGDARPR
jgi:histone-lysine N-methyltransferase SETD2